MFGAVLILTNSYLVYKWTRGEIGDLLVLYTTYRDALDAFANNVQVASILPNASTRFLLFVSLWSLAKIEYCLWTCNV